MRKLFVISDAHIPLQNKKAWACSLGLLKDFKADTVVLLGDFGDYESVSEYPRSKPEVVKLNNEFKALSTALDQLQNIVPEAAFYYLEGNHEDRCSRAMNKYPQFDQLLSIPVQLKLKDRGIVWVPIEKPLIVAGAAFHHGSSTTNRSHAAWHASTYSIARCGNRPVFYGHMHVDQRDRAPNGAFAQCCGWLGDERLVPKGNPSRPTQWVNGVVLVTAEAKLIQSEFIEIKNGKAIFNGVFK